MRYNMFDEDWELMVEQITNKNLQLIQEFAKYLEEKGLSKRTIHNHASNVEFFLNYYLVNYEEKEIEEDKYLPCEAKDGIYYLDQFFGDYFIRKALWSDEKATKQSIASLKKFYLFLKEKGVIDEYDYKEFLDEIKQNKNKWIELINVYNDPNISIEEFYDKYYEY